jgi:hypothetical protein
MPRWPKIYCDRHGFRMDCLHTKAQFLRIVWFSDEFWEIRYWRRNGDPPGYVPPGKLRKNDLDGWMLHTGAYWI